MQNVLEIYPLMRRSTIADIDQIISTCDFSDLKVYSRLIKQRQINLSRTYVHIGFQHLNFLLTYLLKSGICDNVPAHEINLRAVLFKSRLFDWLQQTCIASAICLLSRYCYHSRKGHLSMKNIFKQHNFLERDFSTMAFMVTSSLSTLWTLPPTIS